MSAEELIHIEAKLLVDHILSFRNKDGIQCTLHYDAESGKAIGKSNGKRIFDAEITAAAYKEADFALARYYAFQCPTPKVVGKKEEKDVSSQPRLGVAVLTYLLPPKDQECVLGCLDEIFTRNVIRFGYAGACHRYVKDFTFIVIQYFVPWVNRVVGLADLFTRFTGT